MKKDFDVFVVGNLVSDFLATGVPKDFKWGEHIVVNKEISMNIGGNGGIFSFVASKLGLKVGINSIVGNDIFGRILVDKLKINNIDIRGIKYSEKNQTSATLGIAKHGGERTLYHYMGASTDFNNNCLDFNLINRAKLLHLCAYFLMPGIEGETTIELFKKCKKEGIITSFDIVMDPKNRWKIEEILKYTDIFLPNYDEAYQITKEKKGEKMANSLLDMGVKTAVITIGSEGCFGADKDSELFIPAFKVKAVDSTGAGDCFASGMAYGTLQSWNLKDKLEFASAVGAISVKKAGGTSSAPTLEEVFEFMRNQEKNSNK